MYEYCTLKQKDCGPCFKTDGELYCGMIRSEQNKVKFLQKLASL